MRKLLIIVGLLLLVLGGFRPKLHAQTPDLEAKLAEQDDAMRAELAQKEQEHDARVNPARLVEPMAQPSQTASNGPSATLTVGTNCTFSDLQTAINFANDGDTIQVEGKTFTGSAATIDFTSGKSLIIRGGYSDDCTTFIFGSRTTLNAAGQGRSVLEFVGNSSFSLLADVDIHNFVISGGEADVDDGGGIQINVGYDVALWNSIVRGNTSAQGGGILVNGDFGVRNSRSGNGPDARLFMQDSEVISNVATGAGGGIYCTHDVEVAISVGTQIGKTTFVTPILQVDNGNRADVGGGIYARQGCEVSLGGAVDSNEATSGGGIYLTGSGSQLVMGTRAEIDDNEATSGSGGGVYVSNGGDVRMDGGKITDNDASSNGGGVYVTGDGSTIFASRVFASCDRCLAISGNHAGTNGGGVYGTSGATVSLKQLYMDRNSANFGAAVYVRRTTTGQTSFVGENVSFGRNTVSSNYTLRLYSTDSARTAIDFEGLTFAENTDSTGTVTEIGMRGNYDLEMHGLIIWGADSQNGYFVEDGATATISASVLPAGGSFPPGNVVGEDPMFIAPLINNFHIRPDSPAVNLLPSNTGSLARDIEGNSRPAAGVGYLFGSFLADAGADEAIGRVGINGALCEYATVTEAINNAADGDTIYISEGRYTEQLDEIGKTLTLVPARDGCTSRFDSFMNNEVEIGNDGNSADSNGGLVQITGSHTVTFTNITLKDATAQSGGILSVDGSATAVLIDSTLRNGSASSKGGCANVIGTLKLIDAQIYDCTTTGSGNGAGVALTTGTLTMNGESIIGVLTLSREGGLQGNTSSNHGGGIYAIDGSEIRMRDDSVIVDNSATGNGGGVYLTEPGFLSLSDNSRIIDNSAVNGGGVYAIDTGLLSGKAEIGVGGNSRIGGTTGTEGNVASNSGGGVYLTGWSAELRLSGSGQIVGNMASNTGGGVAIYDNAGMTSSQTTSQVRENSALGNGGGIYLQDTGSTLTVWGGSVMSNTTQMNGGGLAIANGASVRIENEAEIVGNTATEIGGQGGGVYVVQADSRLTLMETSVVRNNSATFGGGVHVSGSGEVMVQDSAEIRANSAPIGGGVYVGGNGNFNAIGLKSANPPQIIDNVAASGAGLGGGIYIIDATDVFLSEMNITGNGASTSGGGLFVDNANLVLNSVSVASNGSNTGGGMTVRNSATVTVTSEMAPASRAEACDPTMLAGESYCSEFFFNSAETGSAIDIDDSVVRIDHTAFTVNHGLSNNFGAVIRSSGLSFTALDTVLISGSFSHAAAIEVGGLGNPNPFNVWNSTIADNAGWPIQADDDAVLSVVRNIIWGNSKGTFIDNAATFGSGCNIAQTIDIGQPFDGFADINSDPLFVGTARGSYFLDPASPAIDACNSGNSVDLENVARPKDGDGSASPNEFDMGAFEYDPDVVPTAVTVSEGVISAEIQPYIIIMVTLTLLLSTVCSVQLERRDRMGV